MREPRFGHSVWVAATFVLVVACSRGREGTTAARRSEPQPITRKECRGGAAQTVDVNGDRRADITHRSEGGRRRCSEVDMNFDGNPDLLRFYDDDGRSVGFEQHDFDFDGRIDDQGYFTSGKLDRKELDTNFDGLVDTWMWCSGPLIARAERARRKPGRVDTWESYQNGLLAEVKYDENNDGMVEKWDLYRQGALSETRVDTTGDGKPDRVDEAESGNQEDSRVSCDGSPLPPETPTAPPPGSSPGAPVADGGPFAPPPGLTTRADAGATGQPTRADAGVTTGAARDVGLSGAARADAGTARSVAHGTSAADAGPIFLRSGGDAGAASLPAAGDAGRGIRR